MTRKEILKKQPGRELDALVAEKVMGVKRVHKEFDAWFDTENQPHSDYVGSWNGTRRCVLKYSTDISAAWEIVESLQMPIFLVKKDNLRSNPEKYTAVCGDVRIDCKSAPEAICKAALIALLKEE